MIFIVVLQSSEYKCFLNCRFAEKDYKGFVLSTGDLTPAQTLDLVSTRNHVLIDIRSEKDKDKSGVPRLPSNVKNRMIAIP